MTDFGLDVDSLSWLLYFLLAILCCGSLRLVPGWELGRAQAILMSLFGWACIGAIVHFVIRFPLLAWDSYAFGNNSSRLADATTDEVNLSLVLAIFYVGFLAAGYAVARGLMSRNSRQTVKLGGEDSTSGQIHLAIVSTVGIIFGSGFIGVPTALLTPLGILGSFWAVPAFFAWHRYFESGERRIPFECWALLLPGVLRVALSPYREHVLTIFLVVMLSALFAGTRVRIGRLIVTLGAAFLVATVVIGAYRQFIWEGYTAEEATSEIKEGYSFEVSYDARWVEALRRFHGFDSLLLTVRYVPDVFPHSERDLIVATLVRGLVPRMFFPEKEGSIRGIEFGETIWGHDEEQIETRAAIIPTMAGDLYEAWGIFMVPLGAVIWGLVLGWLEAWKGRLTARGAGAVTVLFLFQAAASVERDFAHVLSTTIQYLIVGFIVVRIFGRSRHSKSGLDSEIEKALSSAVRR